MVLWKLYSYFLFQPKTIKERYAVASNATESYKPEWHVDDIDWQFKQNRIFNTGTFVEPSSVFAIPSVDGDELNRRIEVNQDLIVLFSAEWCHACRNFLTEFAYAAKFLEEFNNTLSKPLGSIPDIVLIDSKNNEDTFKSFGIDVVPQALFISGDDDAVQISEYTGNNERLSIASWLRQPIEWSRYFYIDSEKEWNLLDAAHPEATLLCLCPDLKSLLNNMGEPPEDMVIAVATSKSLCHKIVKQKVHGCEAFHRMSRDSAWESRDLYSYSNTTNMSWEAITQSDYSIRLNDVTTGRLLRSKLPALIAVHPSDRPDSYYATATIKLQGISRQFSNPTQIGEIGVETPFERRFADFIGLSALWDNDENTALTFQPPSMLILLVPSKIVFPKNNIASSPMNTKVNQLDDMALGDMRNLYIFDQYNWIDVPDETIQHFIENAVLGKIRPTVVKNEAREYSVKHGVLLNVNAVSLAKLIDDPNINLVALIHAGWSIQSYKVETIVTQVAERFSSSSIVFAALNVDTNAVPPVKMSVDGEDKGFGQLYIDSYPAIWAFRRNSSIPIQYIGERNVKALEEYITSVFQASLTRQEL